MNLLPSPTSSASLAMELRPCTAVCSSSSSSSVRGGTGVVAAGISGRGARAGAFSPVSSSKSDSSQLRDSGSARLGNGRLSEFRNCLNRGVSIRKHGNLRGWEKSVAAPRCDGGGRLPGRPGPQGLPMSMSPRISPPGLGQFKPPSTGWVPEPQQASEEEKSRSAERATVLVDKLRNGAGTWLEQAAVVKELQQLGVTSEDMYSMTFVPIVRQLEIVVAAQVYESLAQSGTSPEILQQLDESSMGLLYAIRTISAARRRAAMEYVIESSLTVEEAEKLAWAIKDHSRRPAGRKGFSPAPGDCLAFMYHRQAFESRDLETRESFIELGLAAAVTEGARERFSEFSGERLHDFQ